MMKWIGMPLVLTLLIIGQTRADPIQQVTPFTLTATEIITFDELLGGPSPGTNYDGILALNGASFAEHFAGQVVTHTSGSDILSSLPYGPLTLEAGAPSRNLNIFLYNGITNVLDGLGPSRKTLTFERTVGEGAFAVLFQFDQASFGFDLVGGNVGQAFISFFRRDGTLIDTIILSGLSDQSYAFARENDLRDVAGFSVYNLDPGGIAFDNLRFSAPAASVTELPQ